MHESIVLPLNNLLCKIPDQCLITADVESPVWQMMLSGQDEGPRVRGAGEPPGDRPEPRHGGQRRGRAEAAQHPDGAVQQAGEAGIQ